LNNLILKLITSRFREETKGIDKEVWLTIVDDDNSVQNQISNFETETRDSKQIKTTSHKMAKTANNLMLLSGFMVENGQMIRISLSPPLCDCEKHETVALGGMPIMANKSKCIGGLGIAGLDGVENLRIAQAILPGKLLFIDPDWKEAMLEASKLAYC
jgi:uncharacterized protein GlcG (DUF336 family)